MAAYIRSPSLRAASLLLAGRCGTLVIALVCEVLLYPGIFRAYAGHHVSQTRSTEGRLETWHRSLELVHEHPVWGVGSSNAVFILLPPADEDDDTTGFTSRILQPAHPSAGGERTCRLCLLRDTFLLLAAS